MMGRVEWCQLILFVFSWGIGDLVLANKVTNMDFLYIPEDAMVLWVVAMCIGGLIGAIGQACIMKAQSEKGKDQTWASKYIASTMMTIFTAPILTSVLWGLIAQEWMADITPELYCLVLILATFAIAKYVLLFFNEGVKATLSMLKSDIKDAKEGVAEVKTEIENKQ